MPGWCRSQVSPFFAPRLSMIHLVAHCFSPQHSSENRSALLPLFLDFVTREHAEEMKIHEKFTQFGDLTKPHLDYPLARQMTRHITYNCGPTNSGKTHDALDHLKRAKKGIYCAPLRLLAIEVYQKLNAAGVPCNLVTGQEKRIIPGATVTACTVEMTTVESPFDVAVIDEIQMLGDDMRSFSWSNALLGLLAPKIFLCGDDTAIDLVKKIANMTGDTLEVKRFQRLSPLTVVPPVGSLNNLRVADAVIAFSRNDLHQLKSKIETERKHTCAIVYGKLPPEVRSNQAEYFNKKEVGADILLASDAIGMGLNL